MHRVILLSLLSVLLGCDGFKSHKPQINQPLSIIEVIDLDSNQSVSFPKLTANLTIVKVWATWCQSCRESYSALQSLMDDYEERKIDILLLSVDSHRYAVDEYRLDYPGLAKSFWDKNMQKTGEYWGVKAVPTVFFLDKQGRVIRLSVGALDWSGEVKVWLESYFASQQ